MNVIGVANHAPDRIAIMLKKMGVPPSDILFVDGPIPSRTKKKYLFFLSWASLKSNIDAVNSKAYERSVGFVFDSPMNLHSIKGIRKGDYSESENIHIDGFDLTGFDRTLLDLPSQAIEYRKRNFLTKVLAKVTSSVGILNQLMTFVYTLPNSTHQKPVKTFACLWIAGGVDEDLYTKIEALHKQVGLTDKQKQRLITILTSDACVQYRKAVHAISKEPDRFDALISEHAVSAYEVRYILSIAGSSKL